MFSGEFEISLDEKGRLFVPARFREELGSNLVMWRGVDGQVMVYPRAVWQRVADTLAQQTTSQHVRQARWVLLSGIDVEMDTQGRAVVPRTLRKHADLGSEIVVVGIDDHLEVWNQSRWEQLSQKLLVEAGDIVDHLAQLGIKL